MGMSCMACGRIGYEILAPNDAREGTPATAEGSDTFGESGTSSDDTREEGVAPSSPTPPPVSSLADLHPNALLVEDFEGAWWERWGREEGSLSIATSYTVTDPERGQVLAMHYPATASPNSTTRGLHGHIPDMLNEPRVFMRFWVHGSEFMSGRGASGVLLLAQLNHVDSGGRKFGIDQRSDGGLQVFSNLMIGSTVTADPPDSPHNVAAWTCFELELDLDAETVRVYMNDAIIGEGSGGMDNGLGGVNEFRFQLTRSAAYDGDLTRLYDDLVIATSRIGCW